MQENADADADADADPSPAEWYLRLLPSTRDADAAGPDDGTRERRVPAIPIHGMLPSLKRRSPNHHASCFFCTLSDGHVEHPLGRGPKNIIAGCSHCADHSRKTDIEQWTVDEKNMG